MPQARIIPGDCREVLPTLEAASFDAVVTDAPYELDFMGREWDRTGIAFDVNMWKSVLRTLKPSGYMLVMGGTRTYHRLACAVEDAGFEIRDCLMWMYGTGFPKGKGCLKPAWEPILLARKPGKGVLPLGIDACRIGTESRTYRNGTGGGNSVRLRDAGDGKGGDGRNLENARRYATENRKKPPVTVSGRYPANVLHDGSDEVMEAFAAFGERQGSPAGTWNRNAGKANRGSLNAADDGSLDRQQVASGYGDTGTAARFFYCAKASKAERGEGNTHPTVKPLALMRWMVRLIVPEGGRLLDPFAGSGTTLLAAQQEDREAVGIESDAAYCEIVRKRLDAAPVEKNLFTEAVNP